MRVLSVAELKSAWGQWVGASTDRKIFSVAVLLGVLSIGIKVLSFVKEAVVASWFGVSDFIDAFGIALLLPGFFMNVLGNSLNVVLVPLLIQARTQDDKTALQRTLSVGLTFCLISFLTITLLLFISERMIWNVLAAGFNPDKVELTRNLSLLLWPSLLFYSLARVFGAALNAEKHFALAGITPGVISIMVLLTLIILGPSQHIFALAIGTTIGYLAEAIILAIAVLRRGLRLYPGSIAWLRVITVRFAPIAVGAIFMSATIVADQSIAATLGSGNVAALNYGTKIITLVLTLGAMAIGTSSLPYISAMVTAEKWHDVRITMRRFVILSFVVGIPCAIIIALSSHGIIRLLFERGAFTAEDTTLVAAIQALYALQIPAYIAWILNTRITWALQVHRKFVIVAALNLALNIILNLLFIQWLGVLGIALATSVVTFIVFAILFGLNEQVLAERIQRSA